MGPRLLETPLTLPEKHFEVKKLQIQPALGSDLNTAQVELSITKNAALVELPRLMLISVSATLAVCASRTVDETESLSRPLFMRRCSRPESPIALRGI